MYHPSTTLTSTLTASAITPSYGKAAVFGVMEAMDVDHDGQRPSPLVEGKDPVPMMIDPTHIEPAETESSIAGVKEKLAATPPFNPSLERPREDGESQETPSLMAHLPQKSHFSQNLLTVFGLDQLAASVARFDPATGEKINKMRKSYDGHLKQLALAGKNKSVKYEDTKGMGLSEMAAWPEEEWQNQKVHGKDVHKGLLESIKAKLEKAMQMQPGPVPDNNKWEDLLGIEKVKPLDPSAKVAKVTKLNGQVNGVGAKVTTAPPADAIRPKRTARKRRYDEGSFEGYGEGYVDDDMDIGYTSGETQISKSSASKKRRKTKDFGSGSAGYGERSNSFGNSPVGIATYGR